jgi:putative phage-type endonuclease
MKKLTFQSREDWLNARRGKITGSRLKDIIVKRGTGKKIGYYELIAERIGLPADEENPMDRGTRLEEECIARYQGETGNKVNTDLVIWTRDDNDSIAVSPDGEIDREHAVECKCLGSARHLEAYLTKEVPSEYAEQGIQYFIVNDDLQKLDFAFYDPRIPAIDFFIITLTREQLQDKIDEYLEYQKTTLKEIDEIVNQLTF